MPDIDQVQADGSAAANDGRTRLSNPYPVDSDEWMYWRADFDVETALQERQMSGDHRRVVSSAGNEAVRRPTTAVYRSANGDNWLLEHDEAHHIVAVIHQANVPSGGALTRLPVREFLQRSGDSPEARAVRAALTT